MMDFIFSANDGGSGQTVLGSNVKSDNLPDHPGERPTKVAHKKWVTSWRAQLGQIGYSAVLRGDTPHDVKKLMDRSLIPDPGGTASPNASIAAENARITHQNELNKIERESKMDEIKNRLASKMEQAMTVTCPLRLKRLQVAHAIKVSRGTVIPLSFDGVAMFLAEENEAKNGEVSDYDEKRYHHTHEKLRDNPCKANTTPQSFSDRINLFTAHVNPYMDDTELKGERLSKYILSQLPEDLGSDVRSLRRELEKSNELDDPTIVTKRAMELVEQAHKPDKSSPMDVGVSLVAACFGAVVKSANFENHGERTDSDGSASAGGSLDVTVTVSYTLTSVAQAVPPRRRRSCSAHLPCTRQCVSDLAISSAIIRLVLTSPLWASRRVTARTRLRVY